MRDRLRFVFGRALRFTGRVVLIGLAIAAIAAVAGVIFTTTAQGAIAAVFVALAICGVVAIGLAVLTDPMNPDFAGQTVFLGAGPTAPDDIQVRERQDDILYAAGVILLALDGVFSWICYMAGAPPWRTL